MSMVIRQLFDKCYFQFVIAIECKVIMRNITLSLANKNADFFTC